MLPTPVAPKSEARFRVAIPKPRFEKCCFWRKDDSLNARSVPRGDIFKKFRYSNVLCRDGLAQVFFSAAKTVDRVQIL